MIMRPLRFVLYLSMCRTTDISHFASFAHPRKLIHENFCLKQIFDKPRNIISSKISRPTVVGLYRKSKVSTQCLPYWSFRDQISFSDGILFKGEKIIIPKAMQLEMLKLIHSSHLGIEKCKRQARDILYWPGMSSQIQDVVSTCATCNMYQRKN